MTGSGTFMGKFARCYDDIEKGWVLLGDTFPCISHVSSAGLVREELNFLCSFRLSFQECVLKKLGRWR